LPFILRIALLGEEQAAQSGGRRDDSGDFPLALKPADNETFYREVDEELRREQLTTYWQRYGKAAIALVVLLLAAFGGYLWWQHQREVKAGERSAALISAFDDIAARNKAAAVPKLEELAKSDSPGHRAAAIMTKADLAIEANDVNGAAALFKQVADDVRLDESYRNLATVRMTALQFDRLPPQAVLDRLRPLAVEGNPWFGSAGEMVAISYLKLKRPQDAARIFAAMAKDQKLPDSLRARAVQMAGSLGVDAVQEPAGAAQEGTQ
jgi:hypothetical protein